MASASSSLSHVTALSRSPGAQQQDDESHWGPIPGPFPESGLCIFGKSDAERSGRKRTPQEPKTKIVWGGLQVTIPVFPQSCGRKLSEMEIAGTEMGRCWGQEGQLPGDTSPPAQPPPVSPSFSLLHTNDKRGPGGSSESIGLGTPLFLGSRLPYRRPNSQQAGEGSKTSSVQPHTVVQARDRSSIKGQ